MHSNKLLIAIFALSTAGFTVIGCGSSSKEDQNSIKAEESTTQTPSTSSTSETEENDTSVDSSVLDPSPSSLRIEPPLDEEKAQIKKAVAAYMEAIYTGNAEALCALFSKEVLEAEKSSKKDFSCVREFNSSEEFQSLKGQDIKVESVKGIANTNFDHDEVDVDVRVRLTSVQSGRSTTPKISMVFVLEGEKWRVKSSPSQGGSITEKDRTPQFRL